MISFEQFDERKSNYARVENSVFFATYFGLRGRFMALASRPTTTAMTNMVLAFQDPESM